MKNFNLSFNDGVLSANIRVLACSMEKILLCISYMCVLSSEIWFWLVRFVIDEDLMYTNILIPKSVNYREFLSKFAFLIYNVSIKKS